MGALCALKARPAAGDLVLGASLCETLRPFVYRRYLDFSAIDALRSMKRLLRQDMKRRGLAEDLKLGVGGIREIEFIAQVFQLIHGGRDRRLRTASLPAALTQLAQSGFLAADDEAALQRSYRLLRALEHRVQGWRDEQTQRLPGPGPEEETLAFQLGFADGAALRETLGLERARVAMIFDALIHDPAPPEGMPLGPWERLWATAEELEDAALPECAAEGREVFRSRVPELLRAAAPGRADHRSASRLRAPRALAPRWLAAAAQRPNPFWPWSAPYRFADCAPPHDHLVLLWENPGL